MFQRYQTGDRNWRLLNLLPERLIAESLQDWETHLERISQDAFAK